jgi:hypothetical protein
MYLDKVPSQQQPFRKLSSVETRFSLLLACTGRAENSTRNESDKHLDAMRAANLHHEDTQLEQVKAATFAGQTE